MIQVKDVKKEITALIEENSGWKVSEKEKNKARKRIEYLKEIVNYLENPSTEEGFIQKEHDRVGRRINLIYEGIEKHTAKWDNLLAIKEYKKEMEKEFGIAKLKRQLKALAHLKQSAEFSHA